MSAVEIIEQIKALPVAGRAQVARSIVQQDDSWIPEEFQQAMADADAGRFVEMQAGAVPVSDAAAKARPFTASF